MTAAATNNNFVDHSIADILACQVSPSPMLLVDPVSLQLMYDTSKDEAISIMDLKILARSSQQALYSCPHCDHSQFSLPLQGLIQLGTVSTCSKNESKAKVFTATLMGVKMLESSIRNYLNYTTGKAPLLKTMVHQMKQQDQHSSTVCAPILKTLLLPQGLNLRNLLWHGFITEIPNCWLALVVVLICNMDNQCSNNINNSIHQMKRRITIEPSAASLESLSSITIPEYYTTHKIPVWIPTSHKDIYNLACCWIQQYPTIAAALFSILLEHTLRLEWCKSNDQWQDATAKPGAYYVTLDGHGQHQYHELLLHPYYHKNDNNKQRNKLVQRLGGSRIALLTDVFASSCGGPNLRAALSHGMWDDWIHEELICMVVGGCNMERRENLDKINRLLLWTLADDSKEFIISYEPIFSYSAVTKQTIQNIIRTWHRWLDMRPMMVGSTSSDINNALAVLHLPYGALEQKATQILDWIGKKDCDIVFWTVNDVYAEHDTNALLAECGAARKLLVDVERVHTRYMKSLEDATNCVLENGIDHGSSQQHRRIRSLQSLASLSEDLFGFATIVGLLAIQAKLGSEDNDEKQQVLLKAVERSRMVVSTFETFYHTNAERAIKAAVEYTRGKSIKAALEIMRKSCMSATHDII